MIELASHENFYIRGKRMTRVYCVYSSLVAEHIIIPGDTVSINGTPRVVHQFEAGRSCMCGQCPKHHYIAVKENE